MKMVPSKHLPLENTLDQSYVKLMGEWIGRVGGLVGG